MPAANHARDAEALGYRARGWTYEKIAAEMGYRDRSSARKAAERAMGESVREPTEAAKTLLLADLNAAKQAVWVVLEANHVTISQGKIVGRFAGFAKHPDTDATFLDKDGDPIPLYEEIADDAPVLAAVDRLVKINQEIAKIYGAYAPTQSRVEVITAEMIEEAIAREEALRLEAERAGSSDDADSPGSG